MSLLRNRSRRKERAGVPLPQSWLGIDLIDQPIEPVRGLGLFQL